MTRPTSDRSAPNGTVQLPIVVSVDVRALVELLSDALQQAIRRGLDAVPKAVPAPSVSEKRMAVGEPQPAHLLLRPREAAKLLGISERTLWGYSRSGQLPEPIRVGNNVRYSIDQLREWIDSQSRSART
jgi:predicted DNA-binding transcriptional regulator AlpA